jgi:hypothetical protein
MQGNGIVLPTPKTILALRSKRTCAGNGPESARALPQEEPLKRPGLVIASAAVLVLLSLTQILMAALMGLAAALEHTHEIPGAPQASPALMYCLCAFFLGLAVWGIVTAVGLSKLRRWARTSILIIGGCVAFFGFVAMAGMLVTMLLAPHLLASTGDTQHGSLATVRILFGSFAFIYAAITAIGIFWLVYFNRKTARIAFAGGAEELAVSRRPLLISIYAVLSLVGALGFLLAAFIPFPAIILGVAFTGWKKTLIYLTYAAIQTAIGVGLWKLLEWARKLALGFLALGAAMTLAYLVWPSLILRNDEIVYHSMGVARPLSPQHFHTVMYSVIFGFSLLFMAAIAWMLHYYRGRFAPPATAATIAEV